jgi:heptosyltransferase-2
MHIAIFCPNWIGDLVMATPALRAVRRNFADARLIGVLKPYVAGVLEGGKWFDEIIHAGGDERSQGVLAVAWQLRRRKIDLAILFTNSFRTAWTAWLSGCKRVVGYARDRRSWLLTDKLPALRDAQGRLVPSPVIDAYNHLVEHVGCPQPGYRMMLHTTSDDEVIADRVWHKFHLADAPLIVALNPGAAFGAAKHWPGEYFAELARKLADERGAAALVLCGPGEREMARQIVREANRPKVIGLMDEPVSLGLLKACIRRADLLITTDSGPRHFAAAFDKPVVTLFGPTHIAWTETHHAKAIHMQKAVDCGPCQQRVCPLDHRCMKLLTPAEVYQSAVAVLGRFPRAETPKRGWGWLPFLRDRKRAS